MIKRYVISCDSLIPFSCFEFAVVYSKPLSLRVLAIAATSLGDVPVPLNSSIEASVFDSVRAQPINVSNAKHETYRQVLTLMPNMLHILKRSMKNDSIGRSVGARCDESTSSGRHSEVDVTDSPYGPDHFAS